jgi:hypothetical protein
MSAYTGKSLHVVVEAGENGFGRFGHELGIYTVWTNDGDAPIARCIDQGTAHLFAAAPDLAASCGEMLVLLIALGLANAPTAPQRLAEYPQVIALRAALIKAGL